MWRPPAPTGGGRRPLGRHTPPTAHAAAQLTQGPKLARFAKTPSENQVLAMECINEAHKGNMPGSLTKGFQMQLQHLAY